MLVCSKITREKRKGKVSMKGQETMTLNEYITLKVKLLKQMGFRTVTKDDFAKAKSDLQVDQIAHSIICAL